MEAGRVAPFTASSQASGVRPTPLSSSAPSLSLQEEDWAALLKAEEESIKKMCDTIISFKPDVVITEKGLSDLAAHFFTKVWESVGGTRAGT